MFKLYH